MTMSTNKDSGVKHSTGNPDEGNKKARHPRRHLRTSTGKRAGIRHVTGQLSDLKRLEEEIEEHGRSKAA